MLPGEWLLVLPVGLRILETRCWAGRDNGRSGEGAAESTSSMTAVSSENGIGCSWTVEHGFGDGGTHVWAGVGRRGYGIEESAGMV